MSRLNHSNVGTESSITVWARAEPAHSEILHVKSRLLLIDRVTDCS